MCLSATIATALAAAGQIAEGNAKKQAKDAQALEYEIQAAQSRDAAAQEAKRIRAAGEKTAGAARAALAGAGVVVDQGTAVNINEDIYSKSESDAFNTLLTGNNQAGSYQRSASMSRGAGKDAQSASLLSAATTGFEGWKGVKKEFLDVQAKYGKGS